jgi:hypothetical protein
MTEHSEAERELQKKAGIVKRLGAVLLAALCIPVALLAALFAVEIAKDFRNPNLALAGNLLGLGFMSAMVLFALFLGFRLLLYSARGYDTQPSGRIWQIALGIGFFFPSFFVCAPIAEISSEFLIHGSANADAWAFGLSGFGGLLGATICTVILLRRYKTQNRN